MWSQLCKVPKWNERPGEDFRNVWTSSDVLMSLQDNPDTVAQGSFLVPLQHTTVWRRLNPSGHSYAAQSRIIRERQRLCQDPANTASSQTSISKYCSLKILPGFCGWVVSVMKTRPRILEVSSWVHWETPAGEAAESLADAWFTSVIQTFHSWGRGSAVKK